MCLVCDTGLCVTVCGLWRLAWVYGFSISCPAGRYTSLSSWYTRAPHAQPLLISELRAHPPAVLVQLQALPAALTSPLHPLHSTPLPPLAGREICWASPLRLCPPVERRGGGVSGAC